MKIVQPIRYVSTSSFTMEVEAVTRPCLPLDCLKRWQSDHTATIRTDSMKVEWEVQTGMCQWSTSTFENSCGCTALDIPEWREMTDQTDWRAKQPSQVVCFSEDLQCWGARDTTCGYKAKDITPSITWRREAWKEEALDDLPWKDERGLSSIRRTLEPFQRRHWGNFWEKECRAYGLFLAHGFRLELNWTEQTKLWSKEKKRKRKTKEIENINYNNGIVVPLLVSSCQFFYYRLSVSVSFSFSCSPSAS